MDKTLRTASTGLSAQQRYVEIIANNLANVNTTGFKKVRPEFQDLLYETLRPAGGTQKSGVEPLNEVQVGSGTELISTTKQYKQGDLIQTNNPLDMAINGDGFFVVRKPDNTFAYTRSGNFKVDRNGQVVTPQGFILEPGINIPNDAVDVKISRDGIVSSVTAGTLAETTIGQIELARFVNPGGLRSVGDNMVLETPASGQAIFSQPGTNNTGELIQAQLENSNVDIVEEMVNMITAQRSYEMNSKAVHTADEILGVAVQLKR
ncbi:MAG: Flagellar basal-body rod protein FlgG [Ignavibacteria bacterium]|nr:Flagellar basal-body rod protein FlgG [Ignavibacteria bacterium]